MEIEEDDMIIVVVGDGDKETFTEESTQLSPPIAIKTESLDENEVIEMIATAEKYGHLIKMEPEEDTYIVPDYEGDDTDDVTFERAIKNIRKEEQDRTYEYNDKDNLSDDYLIANDYEALREDNLDDEDYQVPNDNESNWSSDSESGQETRITSRNRRKMLSPLLQKSFVEDLRQRYPDLRNNQKELIKALVEIMRNIKPPEPPKDFFVMSGFEYKCVKCGAHTNCFNAAARHYQEKHGPRHLVCFACGVDFRSNTNLYKHEKRCRAPDAVVVLKARAQFIGRKARSRPYIPDMRSIPLLKQKQKRFACCKCSATFLTKAGLTSHLNLHNGLRPHVCDQCPNAYTSAGALTKHLRTHTGERFICDYCNNSFKAKSALVAHMETHSVVRRFGCHLCPKRYASKNALKHHVRGVHLHLPMPCACAVCPNRYPRMSLLRDHMKKKHGMSLMTRNMFFKALPTMTDDQLKQAQVMFEAEATS